MVSLDNAVTGRKNREVSPLGINVEAFALNVYVL